VARRAAVRAGFFAVLLFTGIAFGAPGDEDELSSDPEYTRGVAAVEAKDWKTAIRLLSSAALRDTRNPEIHNYLGYAYRNAGELPLAFKHYSRALQLNPRHRGAHEYLGEAYLMIGNFPKAEEHLGLLKKICLIPCAEVGELERKIGEFRSAGKPH
jgi:tetratricopeptide (TPR) repeat protein